MIFFFVEFLSAYTGITKSTRTTQAQLSKIILNYPSPPLPTDTRHFRSYNYQKWLPYQILGGKTVKTLQIDPQTKEIWTKRLWHISEYREAELLEISTAIATKSELKKKEFGSTVGVELPIYSCTNRLKPLQPCENGRYCRYCFLKIDLSKLISKLALF